MSFLIKILTSLILLFNYASYSNAKEVKLNEINNLKSKIFFMRHAIAPGFGDPKNFEINDCKTQRNLNDLGKIQSKKIGKFFKENQIPIDLVISSEWCRCKETALIAFKNFKTKNFLNSFYSVKFAVNRKPQMQHLKKYIHNWNNDKNLVLVTHYVVISEALDYASSSGEIVIANKNFKKLANIEINF